MVKTKNLLIATVVLLFFAQMGGAWETDFSRSNASDVFVTSAKTQLHVANGQVLLPAEIATKEIAIEPGKKYKVEINARVESDFVVEDNDRAHIQVLKNYQYRPTSSYWISFLDSEGKGVKFLGSTRGFFLSRTLRPYVFVFTAPKEATSIKVHFQTNGRKTYVSGLRLAEETAEKTVNPNPDFRYGDLNYSGWQPAREGRLYTRPDGKTVLHVGYNGASPYFPLDPTKKYRITAVGEGGSMTLHYYNKDGKSLLSRGFGTVTLKGMEKEVQPPAGAVAGRVSMLGSLILEEFKVVEIK